MTFRTEGYTPAIGLFKSFDFRRFPPEMREKRILWEKKRIVAFRMIKELREKQDENWHKDYRVLKIQDFMDRVSEEEANSVGLREAIERAEASQRRAFLEFLRDCELFVGGGLAPLLQLDHSILDRWPFMQHEYRDFLFLEGGNLIVNCNPLFEAYEGLLQSTSLLRRSALGLNVPKSLLALEQRFSSIVARAAPLKDYEGFPILVREMDIDARKRSQEAAEKKSFERESRTVGRPRKLERAVEAYGKQFPNGHDEYTRDEVIKILKVEQGFSVGHDVLRDAIRIWNSGDYDAD